MEKENTQSCKRCNETYIVVLSYYNYGEWDFNIFDSELELKIFINNEFSKYELCSRDRLYKLKTFKSEPELKKYLFDEKMEYESYIGVNDLIKECGINCGKLDSCLDGNRNKCNKKCILCNHLDIITFKQIVFNEESTENCTPKFLGFIKM